ncbi:16S rRNA (cytosine(967)-C(5))-methyltransferase RsmB [Motiliproteus sediminis]|uniref:16S rRNA (cytosine(967)-C(5))-methyltransferase RsmB n=1 Tax=Motiliproteus sediminis TaxID=1468178 RepID=UPI001AEF80DA|nr:16S rRNA (cytosine(967)-C(5))-methyltransferase RsmB [Motiliproteus sediminis]
MSVRVQAARCLMAVLKQEGSLAQALPPALARTPERDRPLLQELCYGSCRQLPALQLLLSERLAKPLKPKDRDIEALILVGLYQLLHTRIPAHAAIGETVAACQKLKKGWAKGLINGVLRGVQRDPQLSPRGQASNEARHAHPDWLVQQLKQAWPEHAESILAQNNLPAPLTLRVNLTRTNREGYLAQLFEAGISARPGRFSPAAITLDRPADVPTLPGYAEGLFSVQDEAAQLAAGLLQLKAGQRVLDACAAPGGKTGHILETEAALDHCLALELSEQRLPRIEENLARLGLRCEIRAADAARSDWWDGLPFDCILADVPCSATGVIRRNPDIKVLRQAADIQQLSKLQRAILDNLWSMLRPGGRLLYATCSVLPAENERVVGDFLSRHPEAQELPLKVDWGIARPYGRQLFPQENGHDGFYYAVLDKSQ